jgi:hypothetical protein|tara:strand:+ start:35 stop:307 length:273 start_codon:yes stop_codon:yes gene_type:complete
VKNIPWLRRIFYITASLIVAIILFHHVASHAKSKKARFYDFSDQLIDGQIKKPSTLFIDSRTRAKFGKLLFLKKSFREILIVTAKDPLLK